MSNNVESGSGFRTALARCITVSPVEFAADYWGTKPLLSRAADQGEDFSDLFSIEAVDELVAERAVRTPFVRMANEGDLLAAARYSGGSGFGAEVGDQLDPDKVLAEFAGGATLVLQGLHRTWPALREFTRRLVEELGHPAQVNAYITPASSRGFDPHYDVHDVFVIQIHGRKHWVIHPPVLDNPLRDQPWSDRADAVAARAAGEPAIDATFSPGDVLYLPRGWIHSATALGGTSIHLTIGVSAITRWEIVEQAVARLVDDSRLRQSLPIGFDRSTGGQFEQLVNETVAQLVGALESGVESEGIGASLVGRVAASTRPEPVRAISAIERLATLSAADSVRWRRGIDAVIERDSEHVRIVLRAKTVTLPAEAAQAVEALRGGEVSSAASLPGLDEKSSIVVARRLVRESVLVLEP